MKVYILGLMSMVFIGCASGTNGSMQTTSPSVISNSKSKPMEDLYKITYNEWRALLSGNTIISHDNGVTRIWLLSKQNTSERSGIRDDAIEINLNKKIVKDTEWGTCPGYRYYICIGSLRTSEHMRSNFSDYFFMNSDKTKFFITSKDKTNKMVFHIIKGWPKKYVQLAKSKNFSKYTDKNYGLGGLIIKGATNIINASSTSTNAASRSSSTISHCTPDKQCYKIVNSNGNTTTVECRNGSQNYIYYDKDNSKYYQNGALTRHYEKSFRKLANWSCGIY